MLNLADVRRLAAHYVPVNAREESLIAGIRPLHGPAHEIAHLLLAAPWRRRMKNLVWQPELTLRLFRRSLKSTQPVLFTVGLLSQQTSGKRICDGVVVPTSAQTQSLAR